MAKKVLTIIQAKPNFADTVRLDHVGYHPQRREMSIRLSFGYFEGLEWKETGGSNAVIKDQAAIGVDGEVDYVPAKLDFTAFEKSFKATSFKTTSLESWILAFATQDQPGTIVGEA